MRYALAEILVATGFWGAETFEIDDVNTVIEILNKQSRAK